MGTITSKASQVGRWVIEKRWLRPLYGVMLLVFSPILMPALVCAYNMDDVLAYYMAAVSFFRRERSDSE